MSFTDIIPKPFAAVCAMLACTGCFGTSGGGRAGGDTVQEARETTAAVHYTYSIKNTYPHNDRSYTQGLYWYDGYLWEGTGQYRQSALMQVELTTGKAIRTVELDPGYFGEGIALLDGKIYQLTWLEGKALVYDASTLEPVNEFEYPGQGWGLTTDGESLYMSNGTHEILVLEPDTFKKKRTIRVSVDKRRLSQINELEWIDGRIWANVYGTDQIVIIDPQSGSVDGIVDLTGLLPVEHRTPRTDVLNGIAYDAEGDRIFVTGKNWPFLYEIMVYDKK